MDILSLVLIALLVLGTLGWVLKPLVFDDPASPILPARQSFTQAELEQRRDDTYKAIKDLELDYETGKVAPADYQSMRLQLTRQAAGILQQLDRYTGDADARLDGEIDDLLAHFDAHAAGDALLAQTRADLQQAIQAKSPACSVCFAPISPGDLFCSKCGASLVEQCPNCGQSVLPEDAFCAACGCALQR